MKKFLKKYSIFCLLGSIIIMASAIEGENWGIVIISLGIFYLYLQFH